MTVEGKDEVKSRDRENMDYIIRTVLASSSGQRRNSAVASTTNIFFPINHSLHSSTPGVFTSNRHAS